MQVSVRKKNAQPYSALAVGYDLVMSHVDYPLWAEYVHELICAYHPLAQDVLELGCGTGSLALLLQPCGPYRYLGSDLSPEMIRIARRKAREEQIPVEYEVADFTHFEVTEPKDVVILLFDGLNYLLEEDDIRSLFACVYVALRPGGLFIFDQSTPANSINNLEYFEDEGQEGAFSYIRNSHYDEETCLHTTIFNLMKGVERYHEEHVQRAYTMTQIQHLLDEIAFEYLCSYDDFSATPATEESERIHWIVQKPLENQ